jgi:hypothetical protein
MADSSGEGSRPNEEVPSISHKERKKKECPYLLRTGCQDGKRQSRIRADTVPCRSDDPILETFSILQLKRDVQFSVRS